MAGLPTVSLLWQRLAAIEEEMRFDGAAYPQGMCQFPFRLKGQGFFPGGDGLWRADADCRLEKAGHLSKGGVVFLGNDFGTLKQYRKLAANGFENPPTWRHIKERVRLAKIPTELTFFTNAIMGLRIEGTALTKKSWQQMPKFARFCGEFLQYQLAVLEPRLTVVMGPDARGAFDAFAKDANRSRVLYTGHPYADFSLSAERRAADVEALRSAWESS